MRARAHSRSQAHGIACEKKRDGNDHLTLNCCAVQHMKNDATANLTDDDRVKRIGESISFNSKFNCFFFFSFFVYSNFKRKQKTATANEDESHTNEIIIDEIKSNFYGFDFYFIFFFFRWKQTELSIRFVLISFVAVILFHILFEIILFSLNRF